MGIPYCEVKNGEDCSLCSLSDYRYTDLKISVVIPMYNASQSIVKALDSVKYQTYKCTYQILVVNDGSEDCSKETVEKYILENPQMNITLIDQPNGGVSKARNESLKTLLL